MAPSADRRGDLAGSKRKAAAPMPATPEGDGPVSKKRKMPGEDSADNATEVGHALLEKLRKARDKKNWPIATHFLTLPDRDAIPDYYEQIVLPISLETIENKLDRGAYQDTSALESDIKRMIANAKQYNEKNSQIFADAEKIRKMVSVYMEDRNPAYRTPGYQPVPTPIPTGGQEPSSQDPSRISQDDTPVKTEDNADNSKSTRKSGRTVSTPSISAKDDRRASSTPAVADAEGAGEGFEGNSFQQAQDKIITEMMNLTDDENNLISANFLYLPPRALQDYYKVIKHPVSLKGLQKTVRGVKGREAPTGQTLLKSWDAFASEVSYIWQNAREYNEDGSEISALAGELETYFKNRLAEAKPVVAEPPQPKFKLTMKAQEAPKETPKLKLKFGGQKHDDTPSGSVDTEALNRQQDHVRAASTTQPPESNGQANDQSRNVPPKPADTAQVSTEKSDGKPDERSGQVNGVKRELSHGHSPAPGASKLNGVGDHADLNAGATAGTTANSTSQVARSSPHPVVNGSASGNQSAGSTNNTRLRPPGKGISDALITNLNIRTHPDLDAPQKLDYDLPASATHIQQSVTIALSRRQWRLLISPTLSSSLSQRPSKTFVTCNNRRLQALPQADPDQRQPVYEHKLMPGTNTIEVEVIAGMPRGTPKAGTGPDIELEKFTVFAHYQQ